MSLVLFLLVKKWYIVVKYSVSSKFYNAIGVHLLKETNTK